jgi:hypothetical protein
MIVNLLDGSEIVLSIPGIKMQRFKADPVKYHINSLEVSPVEYYRVRKELTGEDPADIIDAEMGGQTFSGLYLPFRRLPIALAIKGIGIERANRLSPLGFEIVDDLLKVDRNKLLNIDGIGEKTVQIIEEQLAENKQRLKFPDNIFTADPPTIIEMYHFTKKDWLEVNMSDLGPGMNIRSFINKKEYDREKSRDFKMTPVNKVLSKVFKMYGSKVVEIELITSPDKRML